ncbi:MAG: transcriptional repressor [Candidatus Eremiobacteraeota bacterium]|nr:transcriptional repressor [Candidatus Eremiobacteraeota bacterium]
MRTPYVTRPREAVAQVLHREKRYLSAAEIHRRLRDAQSKVSLATVYRTLGLLEERGEVSSRVDAGGESTYVSCAPTHHHHAICRTCGKVEDVDCDAVGRFSEALRKYNGFKLDDHEMEFFGRCKACR